MSNSHTHKLLEPAVQPQLTLQETLWQAFKHFYHLDTSNAAFHCSAVRYSPITFRLAEQLWVLGHRGQELFTVIYDLGEYEEDAGR